MMPPKPSLLKLTQTEALRKLYELHHVVQDMLVPMGNLSECLSVFDKEVYIYPLWLCPFKIPNNAKNGQPHRGFIHPVMTESTTSDGSTTSTIVDVNGYSGELFVDVGAYGNPSVKGFVAKETCRRIEAYVASVKGYQMMYADSYLDKAEFRSMFDHSLYDKMRDALPNTTKAFPEIYDKVSKAARI